MSAPELPPRRFEEHTWMQRAACRGADTTAWYPPRDGGIGGTLTARAREICGQCPVRMECLIVGLGEAHGTWGGVDVRSRRALRKAAKVRGAAIVAAEFLGIDPDEQPTDVRASFELPELIMHGTERGADAHRRSGERPCRRCADAETLAQSLRRDAGIRGSRVAW